MSTTALAIALKAKKAAADAMAKAEEAGLDISVSGTKLVIKKGDD